MSGFLGADTHQLRAFSSALAAQSRRVDELMRGLDATILREDAWIGPDAEAFRLSYRTQVRSSALSAAARLAALSKQLTHQADQQDTASSADASAVASPTVVPASGNASASGTLLGLTGAPSAFVSGAAASAALGLLGQRGDNRSARVGTGLRNSPRRSGDDSYDPDAKNPNAQYSTPGPTPTRAGQTGLGTGVPGTRADTPAPPSWTPPADGAGEYDSEFGGPKDHAVHSLAREGADLKRADWPHAADHLDHFLDNTGEDYSTDVDGLLKDQPHVAQKIEETREQAGHDAVAQAQKDGATGPITYPLSTPWASHTGDPDEGDWFYASGSYNFNQTGTVTAYPPDEDHPEWRYEADAQVNFRDRYNWDGGKATQIGPFTVSDESLAALHRGGLAREYNLVGASSTQHSEGSVT